jgi:hypothetical protein
MELIQIGTPDILNRIEFPKEIKQMNSMKALGLIACILLLGLTPLFAQGGRGKAELKAGDGSITIDYGRPSLKGRDMLSMLEPGSFWRMGSNQASVLKTPVDLTFGSVKVPAGEYSIWLKRTGEDTFELVFNSQTGQWGLQHDVSKDLYAAPMKKEAQSNSTETFTIKLKPAANGGTFILDWGNTLLSADFQF